MSTIGQIADKVAKYHQQTRANLVDANGDDLVIMALNNARKELEKLHDFNYCQEQAWVSVDPDAGALMTAAKLVSGATLSSTRVVYIKAVETVYLNDLTNSAIWYPIYLKKKKTLAIAAKEITHRYRFNFVMPTVVGGYDAPLVYYPGDARNNPLLSVRPVTAYVQGQRIFLDPRFTDARTIKMDVNSWMRDYQQNLTLTVATSSTASATVTLSSTPTTLLVGSFLLGRFVTVISGTTITLDGLANTTIIAPTVTPYSNSIDPLTYAGFTTNEAYTDWFVDKAASYLMWAAIIELNVLTGQFVPRQDGYVAPPEKARDSAIQTLMEWDNFLWDQGIQPGVLR